MTLEFRQKLRPQLEWKKLCFLAGGSFQPRFVSHERIRSTKVDPEILVKKNTNTSKTVFFVARYA